jgi:protein TonB
MVEYQPLFCGFINEWHLIENGAGFDSNFLTTKPTIMNTESIMQTDALDLLFEKRNKAYGAYTLRKFYNNRLIKSIGIMMLAVIVFSAFTFMPGHNSTDIYEVVDPGFAKIAPAPKVPEVKPKEIKPAVVKPVSTVKLTSTIVIVKNNLADTLLDLKEMAIGSTTNIVVNGGDVIIGQAGEGPAVIEPAKPAEPIVDVTKPLESAEIMPQYPGGVDALRKFLERNLSNPRDLEAGELIAVKIRVIVGYDGKLKNFELVQDGGTDFNNEVIRVLKKMPTWIPGKTKGQNVSVYYTIPVKFISEG